MLTLTHVTCQQTKTTAGWLATLVSSLDPLALDDVFILCDSCGRIDNLTRFTRHVPMGLKSGVETTLAPVDYTFADIA